MVRQRFGETVTVADAAEPRRFLWILCKSCGRSSRLDPRHVLSLLRTDVSLSETGQKFKRRRCKHRSAAVVVDDRELPVYDITGLCRMMMAPVA